MDGRPARIGSGDVGAPLASHHGAGHDDRRRLGDGRVAGAAVGGWAMAAGAAPAVPGRITAVCGQIAGSASTSAPAAAIPSSANRARKRR